MLRAFLVPSNQRYYGRNSMQNVLTALCAKKWLPHLGSHWLEKGFSGRE